MSTRHRRYGVLLVFGLLAFALMFAPMSATAADAPKWGKAIDAQVAATLAQVGEALCRKIEKLASALSRDRYLKLEIESSFYDPALRRVFVAFKGKGVFTGKLPIKISETGYAVTCDGSISYDLFVREPKPADGGVTFSLEGTTVIFLDKLILDLSSVLVYGAGVPVAQQAASTLLSVVNGFDCDLLAKGVNEVFSSYSTDGLKTLGKTLLEKGKNDPLFAKEVKAAMSTGKALDFLRLSLVYQSIGTVGGTVGGALGTILGTSLLGPVGGVGGMLIGSYVVGNLAKNTVYAFSVELPISSGLGKMRGAMGRKTFAELSPSEKASMGAAMNMVLTPIHEEFERKQFVAFDYTLERIEKVPAADRVAFVPLLNQLQKDIARKVTVEADWYFSKKYYQLKGKVEAWKLDSQVGFTVSPPQSGAPSRAPRN